MNSYRKPKSVAKDVTLLGKGLEDKILDTMKLMSDLVGSTLGPNGRAVLIENQNYGLPHIVTKDGITVARHMGIQDPTMHCVMEIARDASSRTVAEAGDGTTTAIVLSEAIVRYTNQFCNDNPKFSPQKVVRRLEQLFRDEIEPKVKLWSLKANDAMLHSVAKLSANGDVELADNVMKAFELVGDEGNISIVEQSGPSHYEVQALKGFPISVGYEDSCGKYAQLFQNDKSNNRTYLEKPVFLLYFGAITEIQTILMLMEKIGRAWEHPESEGLDKPFNHNVILVATGFSDTVLAILGNNFVRSDTINVFPLITPKGPIQNGEMHFLYDLSAITGATVFDPITKPLDQADLKDLGNSIDSFEAGRYRSTVLGLCDDTLVMIRHDEIMNAVKNAESRLDKQILEERAAKLVGGIAKLIVVGPSSGELREKRDRVEDAVCAVRGAKKHGCLPGGGWTLKSLVNYLEQKFTDDWIVQRVLIPALKEPVFRLFRNCGMNDEEINHCYESIGTETSFVYDALENKVVDAIEGGILDSTPAVLEAIRNSLSIASLLGTTGGIIVFQRDKELELQEAMSVNDFVKSIGE